MLTACVGGEVGPVDINVDSLDVHTCVEPPSSVFRLESGQILVGCSQTAGLTLIEPPQYSDGLEEPLPAFGSSLGPEDLHTHHIHRAHDGAIYFSGFAEVEASRVARVEAWDGTTFDRILDGAALGMEKVIGFARQPDGIDLAIGSEQMFAYRDSGDTWQLGEPSDSLVAFSGTGADVIEHRGHLVALGRQQGLSTLLVQSDDGPHFAPVELPEPGWSLTSLSSDGTDLAVGFNDRSTGIAGALIAYDPTVADDWQYWPVEDTEAQVHAVCQHDGRTIIVGTLAAGDGFVTDIWPSKEIFGETTWLQRAAYACHLDDQGFVLVGGDGYVHIQ